MMKVYIGCSGYSYRDWKGKFYPEQLPTKDWLTFYSTVFNTVEINYTFYRTPGPTTVTNWKEKTEENFNFTLKGNRDITHYKKLNDIDESLNKFQDMAAVMRPKLSCVLWQLPPSLHRDDKLLLNFCERLDIKNKNVIEFRHNSWFNTEVYEILKMSDISICSISSPMFPEEMIVTSNTGYVRFHGKGKKWYDYDYSEEELFQWYKKIRESKVSDVYIYFNNDLGGRAVHNAKALRQLFNLE
ncbi:MAG: DUF72 domain-containing protein [Leeuwenhoekiella sp.]